MLCLVRGIGELKKKSSTAENSYIVYTLNRSVLFSSKIYLIDIFTPTNIEEDISTSNIVYGWGLS